MCYGTKDITVNDTWGNQCQKVEMTQEAYIAMVTDYRGENEKLPTNEIWINDRKYNLSISI